MNDYIILRKSRLDNEEYYQDERNTFQKKKKKKEILFNDKGIINLDDTMILNVYAIINRA